MQDTKSQGTNIVVYPLSTINVKRQLVNIIHHTD